MIKIVREFQKHLMTATSYMLPFVAAGGILYSLSVMLNGGAAVPETGFLARLNQIGAVGLALFIPVLGGYIAFSIADKPGLAPGFIGACLARETGAGFLGGILAGFIAGYSIRLLEKVKIPPAYRTLKTIFLYPLSGTVITGGLIVFVLGVPLANLTAWMTAALNGLSGTTKIPLGMLFGSLVGFDMGGPINKLVYTFAQVQVDTLPYLMGGVGVAGTIPPLGIGLAAMLFKKKFSKADRKSARAAILMGCMGITEGAIPFAAADPLRVVPIYMIGSAIGCTSGFLFGCLNHAPWGGLIVLPVVENRIGYLLSVMLGAGVVALLLNIVKKDCVETAFIGADIEVEELDISFEDF